MVEDLRNAEKLLLPPSYDLSEKERENIVFRRSLFAVKDIQKGERFTMENIRSIRPGYGLKPKHYSEFLGRIATDTIHRGNPLRLYMK